MSYKSTTYGVGKYDIVQAPRKRSKLDKSNSNFVEATDRKAKSIYLVELSRLQIRFCFQQYKCAILKTIDLDEGRVSEIYQASVCRIASLKHGVKGLTQPGFARAEIIRKISQGKN